MERFDPQRQDNDWPVRQNRSITGQRLWRVSGHWYYWSHSHACWCFCLLYFLCVPRYRDCGAIHTKAAYFTNWDCDSRVERSVRMFSILYQQVVGFQALDFVFLDILMKSLHKLCKIKHRLVTHYNTTVTDLFFNLSVIRRSGEMSV